MTKNKYDVAIIGGGPGGYVAAIRLAQLGKKPVVIERADLGGICLNWGCIPTKALLRSAEILHMIKHASDFGIEVQGVKFDIKKIVERSRRVSAQLSSGIDMLMKKNKIEVIKATAKLLNKNRIQLTAAQGQITEISADKIIIATGARPREIKGFEADSVKVWTYKEAMVPSELPSSLIIIGSGVIGVEFASFYASLGVDVTVLEAQDRILSTEDKEIATLAKREFEKAGIKFRTSVKLLSKNVTDKGVIVQFEENGIAQELSADRLIVAAGVVPNTENLGLETTKIKSERGIILTNQYMQTQESDIYAIGDVTSGPWLAHKASHEGIIAAEHIVGLTPQGINKSRIPACIYSNPQMASIGITEEKAKEMGLDVRVGRFPFAANGKAITLGDAKGLIKTIFDASTGELLGAHMIGAEVTELISNFAIAANLECTELDLIHTIFPHPTLSEMLHESVLNAYNAALHI